MLKFKDELPVRSARPLPDGAVDSGPCAMGPVPEGETPISIHVWIFQHLDTGVAAASGDSRAQESFLFAGQWVVGTGLDPESERFSTERPAVAMAMALVSTGDGEQLQHWSQAVTLSREGADPRGEPAA